MKRGKLIIVVGPTGSGKGTLIAYARSLHADLELSVSCTTRAPRPGEAEGEHYYFLSRDEFEKRIAEGDFLEWAEYGGNLYGTPRRAVEERLARGVSVILEIEAQGARIIQGNTAPADRFIIYVDAGSWETLAHRVKARAPITEEELEKRKRHYEDELTYRSEADAVVANPDGGLDAAKDAFAKAIASALGD